MNKSRQIVNSEVYEAINSKPSWFVRNGLGLILFILSVILIASGFVTYPEQFHMRVKIQNMIPNKAFTVSSLDKMLIEKDVAVVCKEQRILAVFHAVSNQYDTIVSPIDGSLFVHTDYDSGTQSVVLLPDSCVYRIYSNISSSEVDNLKVGMQVSIHLLNRQDNQINEIPAFISYIAQISIKGKYSIEMQPLDSCLLVNKKKPLFVDTVDAEAIVDISKTSILSRVFHNFKRF